MIVDRYNKVLNAIRTADRIVNDNISNISLTSGQNLNYYEHAIINHIELLLQKIKFKQRMKFPNPYIEIAKEKYSPSPEEIIQIGSMSVQNVNYKLFPYGLIPGRIKPVWDKKT